MGSECCSFKEKEVKHKNEEKYELEIEKEHVTDVEPKKLKLLHKEKHVEEIQKQHVPNVDQKEVKLLTKEKPVKNLNKEKHGVEIQKQHVADVEKKEVKLFHKEKHVGEIQNEHVTNVDQKEVKLLTKEKPVKNLNKEKHAEEIQKEHVTDVEEKELKHLHKEKHVGEIQKEHVVDVEVKEVKPLNKEKPIKYENHVWFWDERDNPFSKGKPQWTPYDDITSTVIETHFQRYANGTTKEKTVVINERYIVDVKKCFQIKMSDKYCQRPIKRGKPNQRGTRPTNWRFGNDLILTKGKYEPLNKGKIFTGSGCEWLGEEYSKKYGESSITKDTVLQGILDEQKIWNAPSQQDNLKLYNRAALVKKQQEAWRLIFNFHNITDKSIKEILYNWNKHSKDADAARAAILKIYTYETDLYKQLNSANCTKDESKIKTLGPFSYLLYYSLRCPPKVNAQDVKKLCTVYTVQTKTIITYRGLSLDKEAIDSYKKLAQTGGEFEFNGFTSTSVEVGVARIFAKKYAKDGKLPCILAMKVSYDGSYMKAYLNTSEYSAFPNEKEVLLGYVEWQVESVSVENGFTMINLKQRGL